MMKDEPFSQTMQIARPSSTLVIGLGNPILGDDGVGWTVVEKVRQQVVNNPRYQICYRPVDSKVIHHHQLVEVDCAALGGLSLMERMLGYQRVVLVDSMETGQGSVGNVQVVSLHDLANPSAGHSASAHDTSLITALKTAEAMGLPVPHWVEVVAIEARNVYNFSEELSPAVAEAVPLAVQAVMSLLKEEP
jgi:hydrogenase maturation protease